MPPKPKVNASGGEPITMSSAVAFSTCRGQASHAASTSRCVCSAAFGAPVVPLVNAISATSSASVMAAGQSTFLSRANSVSASSVNTLVSTGHCAWAVCSSANNALAHKAWLICPLLMTSDSSRARSIGIVATAINPAFTTASHATAISILFPPRSNTRLPDARHKSSISTRDC